MGKLKIAELVILAATALATVAKSIVKFIEYIIKLKNRSAVNTA